jgi:competence protein ComEA
MKGLHSGRPGPHRTAAPHRLRALLSPDPAEYGNPGEGGNLPDGGNPLEDRNIGEGRAPADGAGTALRAGRFDPSLPGARALVAVGVAAALVAAGYLWLARPRPEPVPAAEVRPAPAAQPPVPSSPMSATGPAGAVVVHVAGKVRRPGVVALPAGARVTDAIKAAGGLRPGAKTGVLNLARRLVDGEQILVGVDQVPAAPGGPAGAGGPVVPGGAAPGAQVDLNTATVEQFDQLPGVGPVLAQRIIDYRTQHGAFRSVDQLQEVTGIGERRYADLKDLVRV